MQKKYFKKKFRQNTLPTVSIYLIKKVLLNLNFFFMKKILFVFTCFLISAKLFAQSDYKAPRFTKVAVGNSGTFAYMPNWKEANKFDMAYSPDSAKVFTGDFAEGEFHFSIIVVKLKDKVNTKEEKEDLTVAYLDYLKTQFEIEQSAGYGKGHTMESNPAAVGIIDYWEDKGKDKWAIKAWADQGTLAVMMIYGPKEYPNYNVQSIFLDGFRFK